MARQRRSFTIRFQDPETHDLLTLLADRLHVSMTSLAETMIRNQIGDMALALEEDLAHTLARLTAYRAANPDPRDEADSFAEAEVTYPDPLVARMVEKSSDAYGIAELFAAAGEEAR